MHVLGDEALAVDRAALDLRSGDSIKEWVSSHQPDLVINCAAYTAVDRAETDRDTAHAVNTRGVGSLAQATARYGGRFVTFSTDYVFTGEKPSGYVESDKPEPMSVYGDTKYQGEIQSLAANPRSLVVRTSWLISGTHPNFASTVLARAAGGEVRVVVDQKGRPTITDDLVAGTLAAVGVDASGILHLANQGEVSRFDLAREIIIQGGLDPDRIIPVESDDYPTPARRPKNSVLDSERLESLGLSPLPPYSTGLARAVERLISH